MILFTPLKTRRLSVQLDELTIEDAIYLCRMPVERAEIGTTEFLRRTVRKDDNLPPGKIGDPRLWTVQEREMVKGHYIAHVMPESDFEVGDLHFSDYLMTGVTEPQDPITDIEAAGESWTFRPLLGLHSESIERLILSGELESGRGGWWRGAMAAQLDCESLPGMTKTDLSEMDDDGIDEHLRARVTVIKNLPESDFFAVLKMFLACTDRTQHLMRLSFGDDGVQFDVAAPEVAGAPPARFPLSAVISQDTRRLFGKPD